MTTSRLLLHPIPPVSSPDGGPALPILPSAGQSAGASLPAPAPPFHTPVGHNGRPATREEVEFVVEAIRSFGHEYRHLIRRHIASVNDNITRGRVVRSVFDRCALEAEDSIVSQMQDMADKISEVE